MAINSSNIKRNNVRERYVFIEGYIILTLIFLPILIGQSLIFEPETDILGIVAISIIWIMALASFLYVIKTKNLEIVGRFMVALSLAGFIFVAFTGIFGGIALYAIFAFPGIIFFILGKPEGIVWVGLYIAMLFSLVFLRAIFGVGLFYETTDLLFTVTIFILFAAIFLLYEQMRERIENKLMLSFNYIDQERAELDRLVSSIGDGVVTIDRSWNITQWNKAATEISGWSEEECLGINLRERIMLLRERDQTENITFIEKAMVMGKPQSIDEKTVLIRKDGSEVPVGDSASPILDNEGRVVGATIIFRNIEKEQEVQSLRGDFKYASHQLRTPVTNIIWSLEAARTTNDLTQKDEFIETAHNAAKSISKMTSQLLVITEIDQGLVTPKYKELSLKKLIESQVVRLNKDISGKRIQLLNNLGEPAFIESDGKILTRLFEELLDNAVKYNVDGGAISINIEESDNWQVVEINDSGIGIDEKEQALIFTKFFRGSNFDTNEIPGAGLGSYICAAYIKILGGKIWFESKPGATSFFMKIPTKRKVN